MSAAKKEACRDRIFDICYIGDSGHLPDAAARLERGEAHESQQNS